MLSKNNKPFKFERAEDNPGFLLWQTTMIWQRLIKRALETYDISHSQFVIMATLLWFELNDFQMTQVQIINWTKLDKMTVSKALKKLSKLGLVDRIENEADTRAKTVTLTTSGKSLTNQLVPIVEQIDTDFFAKISSSDQQGLVKLLRNLIE